MAYQCVSLQPFFTAGAAFTSTSRATAETSCTSNYGPMLHAYDNATLFTASLQNSLSLASNTSEVVIYSTLAILFALGLLFGNKIL